MKAFNIISDVFLSIGKFCSILCPYKTKFIWVPLRRRLYTGYVSRHISYLGKNTLIDTGLQICIGGG